MSLPYLHQMRFLKIAVCHVLSNNFTFFGKAITNTKKLIAIRSVLVYIQIRQPRIYLCKYTSALGKSIDLFLQHLILYRFRQDDILFINICRTANSAMQATHKLN